MSDSPPVEQSEQRHHKPPPEVRRYRLTVAYDGTAFHGWQKQEPPDGPPLRTVAGVIEAALVRLLKQPVSLVGASRTDSGVHARGQVAHFDAACPIPVERLVDAINSRMPDDIDIRAAQVAPFAFDAIRGATAKEYRYRIHNAPHRPLQHRHTVWHCRKPLNVGRMHDAAGRLVGEHDFEGFAAAGHGRTSTVRRIFDCRVERPHHDPDEVHVLVSGNGFLYNMVRIIAGTLAEVGLGRLEPDVVGRILEARDRRQAGTTLPPQGLCLEWIRYESEGEDPL